MVTESEGGAGMEAQLQVRSFCRDLKLAKMQFMIPAILSVIQHGGPRNGGPLWLRFTLDHTKRHFPFK